MPRPKLRTDALRASVLDAVLRLLEEEGPAACTTRRIAKLAGTSPPALYEFFGDKEGLLRAVFFEGFRRLGQRFAELPRTDDARQDLVTTAHVFRAFGREHPALSELMFSRPFAAFAPSKEEQMAGTMTRQFLVGRVRRAIADGAIAGDPTDIAHNLLALIIGLTTQERGGWLGSTPESIQRRWTLGIDALLNGLAP